jgi:acyl-CoA dehydrogenase
LRWLVHGQGGACGSRLWDRAEGDQAFYRAKIATARFYADQMLPQAGAYAETVMAGDAALAGTGDEIF